MVQAAMVSVSTVAIGAFAETGYQWKLLYRLQKAQILKPAMNHFYELFYPAVLLVIEWLGDKTCLVLSLLFNYTSSSGSQTHSEKQSSVGHLFPG